MIRFGWRLGLLIAGLFVAGIVLILSGLFGHQDAGTPTPGSTTTIITPGPVVTIVKPGPTVTQPGTVTHDRTTTNRTTTRTETRVSPQPQPQPTATVTCRPGPAILGGGCK